MSALDQAFIRAYQPPATPRQQGLAAPGADPIAQSASTSTTAAESTVGKGSPKRGPRKAASAKKKAAAPRATESAPPPPQSLPPARGFETTTGAITASPSMTVSPSSRRLPLSSFAQTPQPAEPGFKPALEVDHFRWSTACNELVDQYATHFEPALNALLEADEAGRSLIGIGAAGRGVGCTTIVACLARLLVKSGKTVAVVDGNFAAPGLARHLGLAVESGWEDVLSGALPLAEGAINSLADQLVVLPLVRGGASAAVRLDTIHSSVTAGVLRYHYDMVLFDLGSLTDGLQGPVAQRLARQCRLDGVILTAGVGAATAAQPERLVQAVPDLASLCLGIVENQFRAA